MKITEIKNILKQLKEVSFILPNGKHVPPHFHITELGIISKEYIDWYVREFYPKFFSLFNASYKFYMHTKKSYLWDVAFRLAIFALKRISYKINFEGYDPYAFRTRDIPTITKMIF